MPYTPGLVSIIIASYNYANFLPFAIESALEQCGVEIELVVIDDGSSDNTSDILRQYQCRILKHRQENRGLSSARNRGIELSSGEFVIFLDADDYLWPNTAMSQLNFLRKHPDCGMAVCRSVFFSDTSNDGIPVPNGEWRLFLNDLDIHLFHFNIAPPHAVMLRRKILEEVGGFDTSLSACEDHDMWLRATISGYGLGVNTNTRVAYRQHPKSMSRNLDRQYQSDAILHKRAAMAFLGGSFPIAGRLEAGLACVAGCLLTASRLEKWQNRMANCLRILAIDVAKRLSFENPSPCRHPGTYAYFVARVLLSLFEPFERKSKWALTLYDELNVFFAKAGADISSISKIKNLVNDAHNRLTVR